MEGGIAIYWRLWVVFILCYLFRCVVILYSYHKSGHFIVRQLRIAYSYLLRVIYHIFTMGLHYFYMLLF
jgi:hypothetical protein